ncbi:hypothetical protein E2562_005588 [Oryza meyeriana var. granulata]|uniref:Uncharacterized protein n=1 Tax=Oryza meyeriana var. granulata TaxID=110450 RepID=A0A6G1F418_9ORYZ|nr:hypothetical protein E2562_005588 [Oryza meyeriana var. granulata]
MTLIICHQTEKISYSCAIFQPVRHHVTVPVWHRREEDQLALSRLLPHGHGAIEAWAKRFLGQGVEQQRRRQGVVEAHSREDHWRRCHLGSVPAGGRSVHHPSFASKEGAMELHYSKIVHSSVRLPSPFLPSVPPLLSPPPATVAPHPLSPQDLATRRPRPPDLVARMPWRQSSLPSPRSSTAPHPTRCDHHARLQHLRRRHPFRLCPAVEWGMAPPLSIAPLPVGTNPWGGGAIVTGKRANALAGLCRNGMVGARWA